MTTTVDNLDPSSTPTIAETTTPPAALREPSVIIMHSASPTDVLRQTTLVIRPQSGWQPLNVAELWAYRELLGFLALRDIKVRYKQTVLGAAWAILQPVMMMLVFTIFFGKIAKLDTGQVPYPIFVFTGLLPWTFFSTAITGAGNSVIGSERLITKIYFPRLAIPFAAVGAAVVDFAIALGVLAVLMIWYRIVPNWQILWAPALFLMIALVALGVGTMLAALNVAYRDFRYVIPFLVQLWMFATPTVYMRLMQDTGTYSFKPAHYLLVLNPLTGLIGAFRAATLGGPMPWHLLGLNALSALAVFLLGCLYFRRVEDSFADKI